MPVNVAITIAHPPAAPPAYALCLFEVRSYRGPRDGHAVGHDVTRIALFGADRDGFEEAARVLVKAVSAAIHDVASGLRLAAVAWWADTTLDHCPDGRERLVSVYDPDAGRWGEWVPEEWVTDQLIGAAKKFGTSPRQVIGLLKTCSGAGRR